MSFALAPAAVKSCVVRWLGAPELASAVAKSLNARMMELTPTVVTFPGVPPVAVVTVSVAPPLAAQTPGWTRLPSLQFLELRAGALLETTDKTVADLFGSPLECTTATADPNVSDCRSTFPDPITGRPVELWLSAIDSLVGILTVSGPVTGVQLQAWRSSLESAYGEVPATKQGSQHSLQWIRHRQMLRLTWRELSDSTVASVSLVDGPVLDGWGRRRNPPPSSQ